MMVVLVLRVGENKNEKDSLPSKKVDQSRIHVGINPRSDVLLENMLVWIYPCSGTCFVNTWIYDGWSSWCDSNGDDGPQ
jgi:hypothetical protein